MRSWWAVVIAVLWVAVPVEAKPLPEAMKVSLKNGKPYLSTENVTVLLVDNFDAWTDLNVELADDGAALLLWNARCGMQLDPEETPTKLPVKLLGAKIENAKGMALHLKKKYADAAKKFELAWASDGDTPLYATNYLAALALSGQLDKANTLLEGGIASRHIAWFAWRLAVDPELRKLKAMPGAKQFRTEKPSKLTSKKLSAGVAESPLGIAAIKTSDSYRASFMSFVQLASGAETLRLPLKTGAQQKAVDAVLAGMGFEIADTQVVESADAVKLAGKAGADLDVKQAAALGPYVVFVHRSSGCTVAEFDLHAGAAKH